MPHPGLHHTTIVITLATIHNTTPIETNKCDYNNKYYCILKTRPPDRCSFGLCDRAVHHKCQRSWERFANLDEDDKYKDIFCSEHHPVHQSRFKKYRKLVQEHTSDAMDALCDETSTPKRARLVATQTIASTADQFAKTDKIQC